MRRRKDCDVDGCCLVLIAGAQLFETRAWTYVILKSGLSILSRDLGRILRRWLTDPHDNTERHCHWNKSSMIVTPRGLARTRFPLDLDSDAIWRTPTPTALPLE